MARLEWLRLLLALASGAGLAGAFAPYPFPLLVWVAPAALLFAVCGARGVTAWLCGWLHGLAFYLLTLPWIYTVLRVHGSLAAGQAAALLGLMVAVLALFPAAFAWGVAWLDRRHRRRALLGAPLLWVALEFARTHMPHIGFPWNLLGYALVDELVLRQLAAWTGIYGVSLLVAAANALLVWLVVEWRQRAVRVVAVAALAALLLITQFGRAWVPTESPHVLAHLVQTNLPQSTAGSADWYTRHAADLEELVRLSLTVAGTSPGLIVWPEVPAPFSLQEARFAELAQTIALGRRSFFLVGVIEWRPAASGGLAAFNSAVLLDPAGQRVFTYDKIHLVPFGEYVPKRNWLGFAEPIVGGVGDFAPGSDYAVGRLLGGQFGVFICYEAIFPNEVRRFVVRGAELLINLSNDGWFGRSAAPDQHLAMARFRAIETRRWLLRATNNGHTVVIDPYGRIRARMRADVRGTLSAPFAFRSDTTLYTRFGDWVAWLSLTAGALLFVWPRPPRRR